MEGSASAAGERRLLAPVEAVIPWDAAANALLDARAAQLQGHLGLSRWLARAEAVWAEHQRSTMTFLQQLDYYGKLSAQLPPAALRVVYAASGTIPAVAILRDREAVCEHALYWAAAESQAEARYYLAAILNSEAARARVAALQARGQWGARHFDKVMFSLPIPKFDRRDRLHSRLVRLGAEAERVAARHQAGEREHFVRARQRIREALREDGVAAEIDRLVGKLLR